MDSGRGPDTPSSHLPNKIEFITQLATICRIRYAPQECIEHVQSAQKFKVAYLHRKGRDRVTFQFNGAVVEQRKTKVRKVKEESQRKRE